MPNSFELGFLKRAVETGLTVAAAYSMLKQAALQDIDVHSPLRNFNPKAPNLKKPEIRHPAPVREPSPVSHPNVDIDSKVPVSQPAHIHHPKIHHPEIHHPSHVERPELKPPSEIKRPDPVKHPAIPPAKPIRPPVLPPIHPIDLSRSTLMNPPAAGQLSGLFDKDDS